MLIIRSVLILVLYFFSDVTFILYIFIRYYRMM